jgi:uncharacterized protein YqgC (DUF456 family)
MQELGGIAGTIGIWIGYIAWLLAMGVALLSIPIGVSGGWIALALALLYDLFYNFHAIGWKALLAFALLLAIGEVVEALLGSLYVAKKGATRYGVLGAFVGGLVGAIAGSGVVPLFGTLIGSFVGAFLGAVGGEYLREQRLQPSVRVGMHALVGKVAASGIKFVLALAAAVSAAVVAWPG